MAGGPKPGKRTSNKTSRGIVTNRLRQFFRRPLVPEMAAELRAATLFRFLGGALVDRDISENFRSILTNGYEGTSACTVITAFIRLFVRFFVLHIAIVCFIHVFIFLRYFTIASTFNFSVQNMANNRCLNMPCISCHSLLHR